MKQGVEAKGRAGGTSAPGGQKVKANEAKLALEIAEYLTVIPDGLTMSRTDSALCAKALRAYAKEQPKARRGVVLACVAALPLFGCFCYGDFNGDGVSTLADLKAGRNPFAYQEALDEDLAGLQSAGPPATGNFQNPVKTN